MLYDDFLADPEVANKESLAALGRWAVKGGNFKDEFFLRELKSGGRGHGGGRGRGGRVVEMVGVGVGEVERLGMEQGEMDK